MASVKQETYLELETANGKPVSLGSEVLMHAFGGNRASARLNKKIMKANKKEKDIFERVRDYVDTLDGIGGAKTAQDILNALDRIGPDFKEAGLALMKKMSAQTIAATPAVKITDTLSKKTDIRALNPKKSVVHTQSKRVDIPKFRGGY
jgi:hypothetical protein